MQGRRRASLFLTLTFRLDDGQKGSFSGLLTNSGAVSLVQVWVFMSLAGRLHPDLSYIPTP